MEAMDALDKYASALRAELPVLCEGITESCQVGAKCCGQHVTACQTGVPCHTHCCW